ncbi:MAG: hypothetical protein NTZ54_11635 [Alphaproteobacteria bacterium]|nr:hypothetical protein [Alphaproteobacteria bacterium]
MFKRIMPAALALAFLAIIPLDAALARGGGDGGGGFGGGRGPSDNGPSDRGSLGYGRPQNPSDQGLFDQARRECSGPKYPSGATPRIDYNADTYSCFEPGSSRH